MRTPVLTHTSRQDPDLTEALADSLAALLVQEYSQRHPPRNQQDRADTVASPSGLNHTNDGPSDETDGGVAR